MISHLDFEKKQILFVFASEGDKLSFKNDNVVVTNVDGVIKHQSTCYRLFMICIVGDINITSGIIQRAKKFGFSICMMTRTMKIYEIIGYRMEGNTLLHYKQYNYEGMLIGRQILKNKLINQREAIKHLRIKSETANDTIQKIDAHIDQMDKSVELRSLLGVEGSAARIYFKEIFSTADWKGRKPRIKSDYINSTLDIGYTILFNFVECLLRNYDFDIYRGVLHTNFYMRKSLVCDIIEPMRVIIDLQVRKSINYGQIKEDHFKYLNDKYQLKWEYNAKYTKLLLSPIIENKDSIFIYIRDYYRAFMKGVDIKDYPSFFIY